MVVEELRISGLKPGRWGARLDVDEVLAGNGEGTVSGARSVSMKKPPSMCGWRFSFSTISWIRGSSLRPGEGVNAGFIVPVVSEGDILGK